MEVTPFCEDRLYYEKIKNGFHEEYWASISMEAKDLITKLLTVEPSSRIDAGLALKHAGWWVMMIGCVSAT